MRTSVRKIIFTLPFVLAGVYLIIMKYFEIDIRPQSLYYSIIEPKGNQGVGIEKRELAHHLEIIVNELTSALKENHPPSTKTINALKNIVNRLEPTRPFQENIIKDSKLPQNMSGRDVCPEVYANLTYGYPFYDKGFHRIPCKDVPPLNTLVTVLINPSQANDCTRKLEWIIKGIAGAYPSLRILLMERYSECQLNTEAYSNVEKLYASPASSEGDTWNKLVANAETDYVFIGRDLYHFTWFSQIERLIDVLNNDDNIKIVGGAVRNRTGHWHSGCYQSSLGNYVLQFHDGYYTSRYECMFCDHLLGPFLSKTDFLRENSFDTSLSKSVLFEDFFLRIKNDQYLAMSCPDAMYFTSDSSHQQRLTIRVSWLDLIKKWSLNRVVLPRGRVFKYSCEESGISCKYLYTETKSFLMPICCIEEYAKALEFLEELHVKYNIRYELDSGSVLGAVKSQGIVPWDIDGDLIYLSTNHSFFQAHAKDFEDRGFKLEQVQNPIVYEDKSMTGGLFRLHTPHSVIEMYGVWSLSMDEPNLLPVELHKVPTRVLMNGKWITAPVNPGLYARNRYRTEYLKHAQNWRHLGKTSSWENYSVGQFKPCTKKNHHACLDLFFTDGNLQFLVPN